MGLMVVGFWALCAEFGHSTAPGTGYVVRRVREFLGKRRQVALLLVLYITSFLHVRRACVGVCAFCASDKSVPMGVYASMVVYCMI